MQNLPNVARVFQVNTPWIFPSCLHRGVPWLPSTSLQNLIFLSVVFPKRVTLCSRSRWGTGTRTVAQLWNCDLYRRVGAEANCTLREEKQGFSEGSQHLHTELKAATDGTGMVGGQCVLKLVSVTAMFVDLQPGVRRLCEKRIAGLNSSLLNT